MAKLWTEILVPVVIAGVVAVQTVGVEASRASRLSVWFPSAAKDTVVSEVPDTFKKHVPDTLIVKADSLKSAPDCTAVQGALDSLKPLHDSLGAGGRGLKGTAGDLDSTFGKSPLDSLAEEEDFDLFGDAQEDTVPKVFARDTMKVPDSLKLTDPFLYQWYVAVKDGYTHRIVVDSLKAEGDSLLWPRIDSLYLADSTAVAIEKFNKWYAGLSKAERKRYDYEQKLPILLHRQDSIRKRKDSIQHIKDSIIQTTPRILETAFLPDSLYYKRLVTWRHNRLFNRVETFEWDTTANYHFYDYPFMRKDVGASWQGMPGSAVQEYNWFRRNEENSTSYYQPLEGWTYTPENLTMFNTKTPYTELEYQGNLFNSSSLSSDSYRIFTTQNILPSLNIALEMKRYGGAGTLKNEETGNSTYLVAGNYLGKKYLAHAGFIYNKSTRLESGGVIDNKWIRDTTVDVREIEVNLAAASNRYRKMSFFLDQSFRIPFEFIEELKHRKDTSWVKPDTLNTDMMTGFIGTSSEYSVYTKKYVDKTSAALSAFYHDQFNINPSNSADSLRTMRLDNRIFVRFQPWKEDAIVSKLEGGIGDRFQTFYLQSPSEALYKPSNQRWNTLYAYAGAEGTIGKYLQWDATGMYNFAGSEVNDFFLKANATVNLYPFRRHPKSPISINATFETSLKEPEFYQQHFYSNHFRWENNFGKISTTRITASVNIPKWKLKAHAGYALLAGNVYYDTLGIARQNSTAMSVLSVGLTKNFAFGPVHLDNDALLQLSSNQEVLPLPLLALNLRWYVQFNIVDPKVLQLQLGLNGRYTTAWYAPGYNPVAGVFTLQNEEKYGNCPTFDVFINMQWKKCCIFLKFENAGKGWPMEKRDYFTAHHYIQPPAMIKFGISWPFYPRFGENKTMSARAGSGFGGGSDGGSGFGGLTKSLGR